VGIRLLEALPTACPARKGIVVNVFGEALTVVRALVVKDYRPFDGFSNSRLCSGTSFVGGVIY
jgi:hypothetical protein